MNKSTLLFVFSGMVTTLSVQAADISVAERDPAQTAVNSTPAVDQQSLQQDLLRKQKLSEQQQSSQQEVARYTGRELLENPALLEELFLEALINQNKAILPAYIQIYQQVPNADQSLIDWAKAILQREKDLNQSVATYRSLISSFPDNDFIRFQLAETLFYNQEFEAAKDQFEKLRASPRVQEQDVVVFDKFIEAVNSKEDWNFSFGMTFLNDKNLGNSAKQGTRMDLPHLGPNAHVTYSTPRQKGKGLSLWGGADKRWALSNGKYLALDSNVSTKYYWNNKPYNDVNGQISFGIGYANARFDVQFMPYISKRWYGGGLNGSNALKKYSNTYGTSVSLSYWLSQNVKYSGYYSYGYEMYDKGVDSANYNGALHIVSNSLLYMPSATQYWALSFDFMRKHARDKVNAYERIGARLTWGQEWPFGLGTSTTLGVAKRDYKAPTFFRITQKNDEYSASVSVWHKKIHYAGFTPKITWNYTKTDSNMPIYSYDKNQVFFEIGKTF